MVPGGMIPFRHTIFLWQSFAAVAVEIVVVVGVMWLATPPAGRGKTAARPRDRPRRRQNVERTSVEPRTSTSRASGSSTPRSCSWFVVALGGAYLARYFWQADEPLNALNLNILNLAFLLLGFLLHGTPARLMRAVQDATPAVWGVILQFPFYAGIAGIITATHLNEQVASLFVRISTPATFPALVAIVFGGARRVRAVGRIEMGDRGAVRDGGRAHAEGPPRAGSSSSYDLGEALANLLQPFWMLPILGLFKLGARDVMGYTIVVFLALTPVVLVLW